MPRLLTPHRSFPFLVLLVALRGLKGLLALRLWVRLSLPGGVGVQGLDVLHHLLLRLVHGLYLGQYLLVRYGMLLVGCWRHRRRWCSLRCIF